jgi:hypothetical protein
MGVDVDTETGSRTRNNEIFPLGNTVIAVAGGAKGDILSSPNSRYLVVSSKLERINFDE